MADSPHADLIAHAERLLADRFSGPVRIGEAQALSEPGRRHLILRLPLDEAPDSAPASVVLKYTVPPPPHHIFEPDPHGPLGVANERAGLTLLGELDLPLAPACYGGTQVPGFVLMEDIGDAPGVSEALLRGTADEATAQLCDMAVALGHVHTGTRPHVGRFRELRAQFDHPASEDNRGLDASLRETVGRALDFVATLHVDLGDEARADLDKLVSVVADPGPFGTWTHRDPCPENARIVDGRIRLIDFEYGSIGHALLDGGYARSLFPTCWCARRLPAETLDVVETAYREALADGVPEAQDDAIYIPQMALACGFWTMVGWIFVRDRSVWDGDIAHGTASVRQRLIARAEDFVRLSDTTGHLRGFAGLCERVADALRTEWPGLDPMPLYPAFGGPAHTLPDG